MTRRAGARLVSELRQRLAWGGLFVAGLALGSGAMLAARFPAQAPEIVAVWAVEAAVLAGIGLAVRRVRRRSVPRLAVVFALTPVPGPVLTLSLVPASLPTMIAAFTILPVGMALIVAWDRRSNRAWQASYAALVLGLLLLTPLSGLGTSERFDFAIAVAVACVVGFIGGELVDQLRLRTVQQEVELRRLNRTLRTVAAADPLTGLGNRRRLSADLAALATGPGRAAAVVILDLDFFKDLNDQLGHQAGDRALCRVAGELARQVRRPDDLYRYGGEEFLLVLPGTDLGEAVAIAERLRLAVRGLDIAIDGAGRGPLTLSAGIAAWTPPAGWDAAFASADAALYQAKASGRDRVCCAAA